MDITLVLVTLLSLTLAAVTTTLAWRLARAERRRSDARVAALAAEIESARGPRASTVSPRSERAEAREHRESSVPPARAGAGAAITDDLPLRDAREPWSVARVASGVPVATGGDLFAAARPAPMRSRSAAVFVAGMLLVGCAASLVLVLSESRPDPARSGPAASATPQVSASAPSLTPQQTAAQAAPLELVALTHERDADRLTVRGVVSNPASGAVVNQLTAVVFLFNHDGGFVVSGRASVDAARLVPGAEVPFAVTVAGATDVGRYRVSFRTDERVVPHIDRRDRAMAQLK